ncbi:MAG: hypothetical protein F6K19_42585 [Cyanothece sp. SIO1E1]|nr:hypothetical protein [Cyanothece sp. SIO1E1]
MYIFYSIDKDGFFQGQVILSSKKGVDPLLLIETRPPDGLYKAKWIGEGWIEGATLDEIQAIIDGGITAPDWDEFYKEFRKAGLEAILANSGDIIGLTILVVAFTASDPDAALIVRAWNRVIENVQISAASLELIEQLLSEYKIPFQVDENGIGTVVSEA